MMTRETDALRILVVEDEALIVMDMEAMIEEAGHAMVENAASVRAVRNLEPDLAPDLAFVDLQLARGSSGLDAADHVRATWPDALIVFVTANPGMVLPDIEHGDAVVPKPFSRNGLMTALSFLEHGIKDPPPRMPPPEGLIPNHALRMRWALA